MEFVVSKTFAAISALICLTAFSTGHPAYAGKPKKSRPIVCSGNKDMTVRNRVVETSGDGVVASGNCDLTLVGCRITAGGNGIKSSGNSDVKVRKSTIVGRKNAVLVSGQGSVHAKNSTISGKITTRGNGDFVNASGNTLNAKPKGAPAAGGSAKGGKGKPIVCTGVERIEVKNREIRTGGAGITITGACRVIVRNSKIIAGGVAIKIVGTGDVVISNSEVQGKKAAVHITGTGNVRAKNTKFKGRINKIGTGRLIDEGGNRFD